MLSLLKRRHYATIIVCEQKSSNRKGWAEVLEFRPPRERKEKDATVWIHAQLSFYISTKKFDEKMGCELIVSEPWRDWL